MTYPKFNGNHPTDYQMFLATLGRDFSLSLIGCFEEVFFEEIK